MITKQIFEYILENKKVKIKEKFSDKITEVKIDTSDWEKHAEDAKVNQSLF
jgi:hypothetical protein